MTCIADVQCTVVFRRKLVVDTSAYHKEPAKEAIIKEIKKDKHLMDTKGWEMVDQTFDILYLTQQEPDIVVYPE